MLENENEFDEATEPVDDTSENTPEPPAKPARAPRRRAASRPAGPPPDYDEPGPLTEAGDVAPAAVSGESAEDEEPDDDLAAGTAGIAVPFETAAEAAPVRPIADPFATADPEGGLERSAPEEEPKKRSRARSRKRTEAPAETEAPEVAAEAKPDKKPARRRAGKGATTPPEPEPAAVEEPAVEEEPAPAGVPGVTFQPPMVVFQPPDLTARTEPKPPAPAPAVTEEADEAEAQDDEDETEESGRPSRRRRRRGGRGRGKAKETAEAEETIDDADEAEPEADEVDSADGEDGDETAEESGTSRRRRRRRRRGSGSDDAEDLPPNTVVHVREARPAADRAIEDEVQAVRGSTRLEAKKQRRREGREQGRRRPPIITESEFLARRESVERVMVIRSQGDRTQIAVLEDGILVEHHVDRASHQSYVGNVYLGKVQNVLPSMEAAFVDIGKGRNAVLYAGEVNWDVAGLEGQPRRIESALKSGQSVLVQVTKDPLGHKGARLTSQISLPGRYLVYVPDGSMTGISRKLPDKERTRLKQILKKVMPENAGVIVRTAAEGASEEELASDVSRLAAQWEHIQQQSKSASAPSLLHGEPDLTIRVVRDIFNEDFSKLVVAGEEAWDTVDEYISYVAPHLAGRVSRWDGDQDVFGAYRVDEQLTKALERKVWLPSGGSLVIDRTEAMTVIDVNTGKFTGQGGNLEETVTRNNLEAAEEIVRQLRLRDLGGIIVVDFIDMVLESNRDLVLRRLLECLSRDRTKHQVAEVTSLGLVQMTRKRVGQGLLEAFSEPCECCNGRGIHVSLTPAGEAKADKAEGGSGASRRRKRKGEAGGAMGIEKIVEHKLARHEAAKIAEVAEAAKAAKPDLDVESEAGPEVETEEAPAKPARARRSRGRATKPAGPPPEPDDEPAVAAVSAALPSPAEVAVPDGESAAETVAVDAGTEEIAAEDGAGRARGRRRTTRAARTEAPAEEQDAPEAVPAEPVAEPVADAEAASPNGRTRARRTRRTTKAKAEVGADDAADA